MQSLGQEGSSLPVESTANQEINHALLFLVLQAEKDKVADDEEQFGEFKKKVLALKDQGANLNAIFDIADSSKAILDLVDNPKMAQFLNEHGAYSFIGAIKNAPYLTVLDLRSCYPDDDLLNEIDAKCTAVKTVNLTGSDKYHYGRTNVTRACLEHFLKTHEQVEVIIGEKDRKALCPEEHPRVRVEVDIPQTKISLPITKQNLDVLQPYFYPKYKGERKKNLDNMLYVLVLDAKERKLSDDETHFELFKGRAQTLVEAGAQVDRGFHEGTVLDCAVGDIELFKFIYDRLGARHTLSPIELLKKHNGVVTDLDMSHLPVSSYHLSLLGKHCPELKSVNLTGSLYCANVLSDYSSLCAAKTKIKLSMQDLLRLGFLHGVSEREESFFQGADPKLTPIRLEHLQSFLEQMSVPNAFRMGEGRLDISAFSINQRSLQFSCYDASNESARQYPLRHLLVVHKNVSMIEVDGNLDDRGQHKVDLNAAFKELMECLGDYPGIRTLAIVRFKLTKEQLQNIVDLFAQNKRIKYLEITEACLENAELEFLQQSLKEQLIVYSGDPDFSFNYHVKSGIMRVPRVDSVFEPFINILTFRAAVFAEFEIDSASFAKHALQPARTKETLDTKIRSLAKGKLRGLRAPLLHFSEADNLDKDEISSIVFAQALEDVSRDFQVFEEFYYKYRFFQYIANEESLEIFWAFRDWVNASERSFRDTQFRKQQLVQLIELPKLKTYYEGVFLGLRSRLLACGLEVDTSKGKEEADSKDKKKESNNESDELAQILAHKLIFLRFISGGEFEIENATIEFHLVPASPFYMRAIKLFELTSRLITLGSVRQAKILALNSDAEVIECAEQAAADITQMIINERIQAFSTIEQTAGVLAASELLGIQQINNAFQRLNHERNLEEQLVLITKQLDAVSNKTDLVLQDTNAINTTTLESQEQIKQVIEGQVELMRGQAELLRITKKIEIKVDQTLVKLDNVVKMLPDIHASILEQLKMNREVSEEDFEKIEQALEWQREIAQRHFESFQVYKEQSTKALEELHKDLNLMVASTANPTQQAQYYFPGNTKLHSFCQEMFVFASSKIEKYKDIVNTGEVPDDSVHSALNFVGTNADMVPVPFVPLVLKGLVAIGKGIYNGFKKNRAKKLNTFSMDDVLFGLVRRTAESYALTIERLADHNSIVAMAKTAFGLITTNIIESKLFEQNLEGKSTIELEDLLLAGLLAEHSIHRLPGGKRTPFVGTAIQFEEPKVPAGQAKPADAKSVGKKLRDKGVGVLHSAVGAIDPKVVEGKAKELLKSKADLEVDTTDLIPIITKGKKLLDGAITVFTHEPTAEAALMFPCAIIVKGSAGLTRYNKDETGLAPNIMVNMLAYQRCFVTTEIVSHAKEAKNMQGRLLDRGPESHTLEIATYENHMQTFGDTLNDPDNTAAADEAKARSEAAGKRLYFQTTLMCAQCIEIGRRPPNKQETGQVHLTFTAEEFNLRTIGLSACAPLVKVDTYPEQYRATLTCQWELFELIEAAQRFVRQPPKVIEIASIHEEHQAEAGIISLAPERAAPAAETGLVLLASQGVEHPAEPDSAPPASVPVPLAVEVRSEPPALEATSKPAEQHQNESPKPKSSSPRFIGGAASHSQARDDRDPDAEEIAQRPSVRGAETENSAGSKKGVTQRKCVVM